MKIERSAPGTVVPTAVISSVMPAPPVNGPAAVNCAVVAATDSAPAGTVNVIHSVPPTLMLHVTPAPVGPVFRYTTTLSGAQPVFRATTGQRLLPIANV